MLFGKNFNFTSTLEFHSCYHCGTDRDLCRSSVTTADESLLEILTPFFTLFSLVNRQSINLPICRRCRQPLWVILAIHLLAVLLSFGIGYVMHLKGITWASMLILVLAPVAGIVSYVLIRDWILGVQIDRSGGTFNYDVATRFLGKFQKEFTEEIYSSESKTFGIIAPYLPGKFFVSDSKLRLVEPEFFGVRGILGRLKAFFCTDWSPKIYLDEKMLYCDCRAAVVIENRPLLVAAYSGELDCVVILEFPDELLMKYELKIGTKLLSSNTYDTHAVSDGDLFPGPRKKNDGWQYFQPIIADFVADDPERIKYCKSQLDPEEWKRAFKMGLAFRKAHPNATRDGKPTRSGKSALP